MKRHGAYNYLEPGDVTRSTDQDCFAGHWRMLREDAGYTIQGKSLPHRRKVKRRKKA